MARSPRDRIDSRAAAPEPVALSRKRLVAIAAAPILVVSMLGVFRLLAHLLGPELGWYAGFWIYWPVWCLLFPWWMLGGRRIRELFRHRRLSPLAWVLVAFPPAMALIGGVLFAQQQTEPWTMAVWVVMAFANGILEELLWRGVYTSLFPGRLGWGLVWPTLWFALWHYGPGGLHPGVWTLMAGAAGLGGCLGWVAMKSGTIRYCAASHTLSGLFWGLV